MPAVSEADAIVTAANSIGLMRTFFDNVSRSWPVCGDPMQTTPLAQIDYLLNCTERQLGSIL